MSNRLLFSKTGRAKYISHLDLMRTFQRIFMRAGIQIRHTEGFNPHAYISIALPLSVGCESKCEILDFDLIDQSQLNGLSQALTKVSPEGIVIKEAYETQTKSKNIRWLKVSGKFIYDSGVPEKTMDALNELFSRESIVILKKGKKGMVETDIAPNINSIEFTPLSETELNMTAVIAAQNPSLNPELIKSAVTQLIPDFSPDFCTFMREEIYDENMNVFR